MGRTTFNGAAPIFRVARLAASLEYYVTVLGFTIDWEDRGIAAVSRDRCCLFLSQDDQGQPGAWTWIGVGDVDAVFEELRAKGARVRHPPTNYPWALEMQVEDLDGNVLRLGSDPRPGEPIGAWLDMYGETWVESPGGGWTRADRD